MGVRPSGFGRLAAVLLVLGCGGPVEALDPRKAVTQYTRTVWTQAQGLPQDTIRAIAQGRDGYLWLGTDEGLARFDGYEFTVFNKDKGDLPGNSVTALAAASDGALWVGTADGLACYQNRRFRVFSTRDGLPDNSIAALLAASDGALWVVAGVALCRYQNDVFKCYAPVKDVPVSAVRTVAEDGAHRIWVGGYGGVARLENGRFILFHEAGTLGGDIAINLLVDRRMNLWVGGSQGILMVPPKGRVQRYAVREGLPDPFVRSLCEDRDGNIWAGTNGGLARFEEGRFVSPVLDVSGGRDWVRSVFEDREGNLWVGTNRGLNRFRDDVFTVLSKAEGLPSDQPTTVHEDRQGRVWVGFHDAGLMLLGERDRRVYTMRDGLAGNEVFSIRDDRRGNLLVAVRGGISRLQGNRFVNYVPGGGPGGRAVFDAMEDRRGRLWLGTANGLLELRGSRERLVAPGGPLLNTAVIVLAESPDGTIWAGTYGKGLWRCGEGEPKLFSTADGLPSDQVRALLPDADGSLWIGTFGAGLCRLSGGRFVRFTSKDGLLSDNISDIADDGRGALWLSTTRGICRVERRDLEAFAAGRSQRLAPVNFGVEDGLRSAQCAPGYPIGGGAARSRDGRLWFPTTRGLAVLDPAAKRPPVLPPLLQMVEVSADRLAVDFSRPPRFPAGEGRVQFRYTGIHLSAPERVRYSFRLEGVDRDWAQAVTRRMANYNSLRRGRYRFVVRAAVAGAPPSELAYSFELEPHFYETWWFAALSVLLLVAGVRAAWMMRVRALRGRFALVLDERARLAREIHDTLAQGFVGISSQLDAVALAMPEHDGPARRFLETARRMARHSLTEARRSVMDLRASMLEGQDLASALRAGAPLWIAGAPLEVEVRATGGSVPLPPATEQHLLRIAQEAVANVAKHAAATRVTLHLHTEPRKVYLRIVDNGRGFDHQGAFSAAEGHFGLLGMRERAERVGGQLTLESKPGEGTQVEVVVPLP